MKPGRKRTPITFEGRTFESIDAFEVEFPAYRRAIHHIRAGATTIIEVERAVAASVAKARKINRDSIKANRRKQPTVFGKRPL